MTRRKVIGNGLRLMYAHPLMRPYQVVGMKAEPPTPRPYLLHPDEIAVVEAIRRGRRQHPYPGTKAA